jgi:glucose/arabinose dehydrogenase
MKRNITDIVIFTAILEVVPHIKGDHSMKKLLILIMMIFTVTEMTYAQPSITLNPVASGFSLPVLATHAGDGSGRIFIVERGGTVKIFDGVSVLGTDFLDISTLITSSNSEQGLLGLAFHPNYDGSGGPTGERQIYVNYTRLADGATVISRFTVPSGTPNDADESTEFIILTFAQPEPNHNGGMIAFGPDGYLYISTGDGGGGGDIHGLNGNAQNTSTGNMLGKILRLDVDGGSPYAIPGGIGGNPFEGSGTDAQEIYAWGLRNPWRFSFDRETGALLCGDVGQGDWEEVDIIENGLNYGWRCLEGFSTYNNNGLCATPPVNEDPVHVYVNDGVFNRAVTGGYVYRGETYGDLDGWYFFADYNSGKIWVLEETAPGSGMWNSTSAELLDNAFAISAFGEDEDGELYVVSYSGGDIYQIESTATYVQGWTGLE